MHLRLERHEIIETAIGMGLIMYIHMLIVHSSINGVCK